MSKYVELMVTNGLNRDHKSMYFGTFVGARDSDEFIDRLRMDLVRLPKSLFRFAILSIDELPEGQPFLPPNYTKIGIIIEPVPAPNN